MTPDQHLAHLVWMLEPPFRENFREWAWHRAKQLAADPELADLPRLLAEAMRAKGTSTATAEPKSSP